MLSGSGKVYLIYYTLIFLFINRLLIFIYIYLINTDHTMRNYYRELTEERKIEVRHEDLKLMVTLNLDDQRSGFNEILDHVVNNRGKVFFMDGPGGIGKK